MPSNPFRCTVTLHRDLPPAFKNMVYPHTLAAEAVKGGSFFVEYRTARGTTEHIYYASGTWITAKLEDCWPGDEWPEGDLEV